MNFETQKFKVYTYTSANGKVRTIKRKWNVKQDKALQKQELNDYFTNNSDRIQQMKNITAVYEDYNKTHDNKLNYGMIYRKYTSIYKSKKEQKNENNKLSSDEITTNDVDIEL